MRTIDQIMHAAETTPGNTLLVSREEAELCIECLLAEIRIGTRLTREVARQQMRKGHFSLFGKQITIGRDLPCVPEQSRTES